MAGDLYDQGMKNKSYAAQKAKAAKLVDPGLLTEPAKASQRVRKGNGPAYEASHGDEYSAGTQGAEPKRFAKGGPVEKDDDAVEDWANIGKGVHKHEANMHKGEKETKFAKGGRVNDRDADDGYAKGGRPKMNLHLKKGALHKEMGISQGKKIPAGRLKSAANSDNETLRKRAQFAINAKKWHHKDGGHIDAAEGTSGAAAETGVRKGPKNPEQAYAKGGDVKESKKDSKPAPKSNPVPRNKVAKMAPPMPPAMAGPPPAMPPAPPPAAGGMPGFAVGGIAKIRHGEMTKSQKQTPNKPSGWNAYK